MLMKRQRYCFRLIAAGLTLCLLLTAAGGVWMLQRPDLVPLRDEADRLAFAGRNTAEGRITDRTGLLLSDDPPSEDESAENALLRQAALPLAGDRAGRIPGGARALFASDLFSARPSLTEAISVITKKTQRTANTLMLTLDAALSAEMVRSFRAHTDDSFSRGAALMLNYRTGEVLALLSLPLPGFSQPQTEETDAPAVGLAAPGLSGWGFLSPFVTGARAEESAAFINQATGALFPADDLLGKLLRQAGLWPESAASLPDALSALPHRLGFDEPWQFEELPAVVSSAGGADASCLITPLHACLLAAASAAEGELAEPRIRLSVTSGTGALQRAMKVSARSWLDGETALRLLDGFRSGDTVLPVSLPLLDIRGLSSSGELPSADAGQQHLFASPATEQAGWYAGCNAQNDFPIALCVLVCAGAEAGSAEKAACEIAKDCFLWARNHPNELMTYETAPVPSPDPVSESPAAEEPTPVPAPTPNTFGL